MNSNYPAMNPLASSSGFQLTVEGFTNDGSGQPQVGGNLTVGYATGQPTGQDLASGSTMFHSFSEAAPQHLCYGSLQHPPSRCYVEGNGTTGLNGQQAFALNSEHNGSNGQHQYVSHMMVGDGTTGLNPRQDFALRSVGGIRDMGQHSGSGLLQGIYTPIAAPNQPDKTKRRKSNSQCVKDSRRKTNKLVNELIEGKERSLKEIEAAKRALDDSNKKLDVLDREVQQLKEERARYKELLEQEKNQIQSLTKLLENVTSPENAGLKGEIKKLQEENKELKAQNDLLMQGHNGDENWIKINLRDRPYVLKSGILKLRRLSRND